jgi:hypothetical protein
MLLASLASGAAEPSRQESIVPNPDEATWRSGWSVDGLRELFRHGKPSNDLSEVGLTIHSFDGSEHYQQPWKPCTTDDWCRPFRTWWSASVVNSKHAHAVSDSGVLLAPKHTRVLCSAANATALGVDCTGAQQTLRHMLDTSLDASASASALANEVRFDSQHYVRQLPDSVAGFFYFDDAETPGVVEAARSKASRAYLAFLREYQLTEADVPLLRLSRGLSPSKGAGVNAVADESKLARECLRRHSYERFRSHHRGLHLPESPPDGFGAAADDEAGAASEAGGPRGRPDGRNMKASPHSPDRLRSNACVKDEVRKAGISYPTPTPAPAPAPAPTPTPTPNPTPTPAPTLTPTPTPTPTPAPTPTPTPTPYPYPYPLPLPRGARRRIGRWPI